MTPEQRQFVSTQELSRFEAWKPWKLGKGPRLTWALAFAQECLEQLSPGRLYDLRLELLIFLKYASGLWARDEPWVRRIVLDRAKEGGIVRRGSLSQIALPTEDELRATQTAWRHIIMMTLDGGESSLGDYQVTLDFRGGNGRATVTESLKPALVPDQATYALARLLLELDRDLQEAGVRGPLIKACPAPKVRGDAEDLCDRWFVGRPNQRYCSSQCQNRAATRATRARASSEKSETKRGRRPRQTKAKG